MYETYPNEPDLPKLPLQYAEYSTLQKEKLAGDALHSHLEFWRQELAHSPEFLELPADRPRLVRSSPRGELCSIRLTKELMAGVQQLSREQVVTPFMLCLAVFEVLLFRLTTRPDILLGVPVSGRDRAGTEQLIGFFSNTIVLRSRLQSTIPFREFLQQVRARTLLAFSHRELPFEKLVEELRPTRRGDSTPFVQVMFDMQSPWGAGLALPGIDSRVEVLNTKTTKFDLTLTVITDPDGWIAEIEFDAELFNRDTVQRWLNHFEALLGAVLANPDMFLGELPV